MLELFDTTTLIDASTLVADHQHTVLIDGDQEAVVAALDSPAEPTGALRAAMALNRDWAAPDG